MKKEYFDEYRLVRIINAKSADPQYAKKAFEEYIKDYPNDYTTYGYYAETLVYLGELEKARETLEQFERVIETDARYSKVKTKKQKELIKMNYLYAKVKLLFYEGKYQECYDLAYKEINNFMHANIALASVLYCCKYHLGYEKLYADDEGFYAYDQLYKYSEDRFKEHVKRHLAGEELLDESERSIGIFNHEFQFDKVFNEVKKLVPTTKSYNHGIGNDAYFFRYDLCGTSEGKGCDYFVVFAYHGLDQFITMYPTPIGRTHEYTDLNYLKEEDNQKRKKLSQIEKFNKKYGL